MNRYRCLQVQYNQGLVKTFLIDERATLGAALDAVAAAGRFRSLRVKGTVDEGAASLLADTGNATRVEVRSG